jgi:hypothetical protein
MASTTLRSLCLASALAIAGTGIASAPASAGGQSGISPGDASAIVEDVAGRVVVDRSADASDVAAIDADVSTDPDSGLTVSGPGESSISLGIPGTPDPGVIDHGNVVYPNAAPATDVVARPTNDGAQALLVIDGPDAPQRFAFPVEVGGAPAALVVQPDGTVNVHPDETGSAPMAVVAPAWAVDAVGARVPTHFEVEDNHLVQVVDHAGAAYPVVADPKVSFGWSIYLKYSKKEVRRFASKGGVIGAGFLVGAVCGAMPGSVSKAVCGASVAVATAALLNTFNKADREGKCVELKFSYVGDLDGWKRYRC